MDMDDRTRSIMERARLRKAELESDDGKENSHSSAGDSAFGGSPCTQLNNSPMKSWNKVKETSVDADIVKGDVAPPKPRRSAFDALAENFDALAENDKHAKTSPTKQVVKENLPKSHRLSMGETRPSVLCTPAGFAASRSPTSNISRKEDSMHISMKDDISPFKQRGKPEDEDARRIRFAHPIAATSTFYEESSLYSTTINESSIISGSGRNQTVHSLPGSSRKGSTDDGEDMSTDEYGAHRFVKKKTPSKSPSSSSIIGSPKPFVRGRSSSKFTHVPFNPAATSSPKVEESVISVDTLLTSELTVTSPATTPNNRSAARRDFLAELEESARIATTTGGHSSPIITSKSIFLSSKKESHMTEEMSPVRNVARENAAARNIAQQFEEKIKTTHATIPVPKAPFASSENHAVAKEPVMKTQWRGATGTPVVTGSTPGQPTKPDVRADNIKSLRNRWEFSSITGTPLHPDESEDALVQAAIRMRDTAIPKRVGQRKEHEIEERSPQSTHCTPLSGNPKAFVDRSATASPEAKSPRYEPEKSPHKSAFSPLVRSPKKMVQSPARKQIEEPEKTEVNQDLFADNEDSEGSLDQGANYSKLIDDAFDFMGRSPSKTPSRTPSRPAPLATLEQTPDVLRSVSPAEENDEVAELPSRKNEGEDEPKRGSGLQYTISYYRKRARQQQEADPTLEKIDLNTTTSTTPSQQVIGGSSFVEEPANVDELRNQLETIIYTQKTKIHQASKALQLCKNKEEFRGSHEEATAQRAVLVETEVYRAAVNELDRLNKNGPVVCDGPVGTLTLTQISVDLSRDFVTGYNHIRSTSSYYFCVILRCGEKVLHTGIVSSEEAIKKGFIEIVQPMTLKDLPTNFIAVLEIYSFRTIRSQFTHEEKFGLKGSTVKHKTISRASTNHTVSAGGPAAVADTSFQLVGRLTLDIHSPCGKKKFALSNVVHPLEGSISIKMKKQAMGKSTTTHKGFLSMFQRTKEGLGSWNRYWCVLEQGGMKFWRRPEDETNDKNWLVLLDLQTCAGDKEGASEVNEPCQYMFSFFIDVWVPKEGHEDSESLNRTGRPEMEKLRVNLAADTKDEMRSWLLDINQTVKQLLTWNRPFAFAK